MTPATASPTILRAEPADAEAGALDLAAEVLRAGGLVALPTETVYGLGADARNAAAVSRIFALKRRPPDNPLIVHVADLQAAAAVAAEITPLARQLATRWWPGPLTLVLDAAAGLPPVTTGGLATVALRVPDHPLALAVLRRADVPVAAPSANRSGRPSPTTAAHVVADLGAGVDLVIDGGACPLGVESTVVDARGEVPVVLREGAVSREQLGLPARAPAAAASSDAASPGTRYRHYAPSCRVELAPPGRGAAVASALALDGVSVGLVAPRSGLPCQPGPGPRGASAGVHQLLAYRDVAQLARGLYAALRAADDLGLDVVVVDEVDESGLGRAVMDRLRRAAAG